MLSTGKPNQLLDVLGVQISAVNMESAVRTVFNWIEREEKQYVCVTGVHGVVESQKDIDLLAIHNASGLTVPDGMPLVWLGKIHGFDQMKRVYGPDFMMEICRCSVPKGYTHFLYGGNIGVADELRARLEDKLPGIKIVGMYTPPFRPLNEGEEEELQKRVEDAQPDLFWVGLSTPKQERFMGSYLPRLNTKVMLGVGAAFDIHTGRAKDAPQWIKRIGMQWFYRLCQEPRRLGRRYLYSNSVFIYKVLRQLLNEKRESEGRAR